MEPSVENLLNASEVAKWLGIHKMTLGRLARLGEIPAIKVGSSWRFKKSAIEEYLNNSSNQKAEV